MPATNTDPQSVALDANNDINKAVTRLRRLAKAAVTPDYVKADATSAVDKLTSAMGNVLAIINDSNHPEPVVSASAPQNGTPAKAKA